MPPASQFFSISLGYASDEQRNSVHAAIKEQANGWWHNLPDTWIVGGHDHKFWADLVKPVLAETAARVLVLELPRDVDARMFAARGPFKTSATDWLWHTYYKHKRPNET